MKLVHLLCCVILLSPTYAFAQLIDIVGGPVDTLPCTQPCRTLSANFFKPLRTTSYQASSVAYSPEAVTAPSNLNLQDDKFSNAVPIGFTFCFYGASYTQLYISANGHITFNPAYSTANCSFDTRQAMPFYSASYPDNAIFCPFNDGNTGLGGTIEYTTKGVAPFRKFVVQYTNIPFFGTACTGAPATFQCVLSESTNDIEFFITNKSTCNTDTSNYLNYATLGIQSIAAQNFLVVNNRNASVWTANNEGWKISPAGPPAYTLRWFSGTAQIGTNVASVQVCDPFPTTVTAELTLLCPAKVLKDTMRIVKDRAIIDSIKTTKTACKNTSTGSATVYASGGTPPYTYSLNGGPYGPSNTFNNLPMGSHYVQVKDANGCVTIEFFNIGVISTLGVSITSKFDPYCPTNNGAINTQASGGAPPYSYVWNSSQTTANISGLGPGTYSVTVTDAQGCIVTLTETLEWDPLSLPVISDSVNKPVCGDNSGSIFLSASNGTAPYTYLWTTPSSIGPSLQNLPSNMYAATVTDANGCSSTYAITLNDTLNMQLQIISFAHTTCGLNNGMGNALATNGLPPYNYSWSNSATTPLTNTLSAGWHYITVTDGNNCTRTDSINLNTSVPLTLQFLPANAYCDEDNGLISTIITGNTGPVNYSWSTSETSSLIDSLAAGSYALTITDSVGCTLTDTAVITNVGKPKLIVVDYQAPLCNGDSTGRLELSGVNGVAPYKYSFDGVNFSAVAIKTNFAAGTYTIYMRDANSCESDTTITFDPPDPIDINTTFVDTLICYYDPSGPITFSASDGLAPYRWSTERDNYSSQNTFSGFGIGMNTIYVIDANNCKNELDFEIPGPPAPLKINLNITDVPCYESGTGKIEATAQGGWGQYNYIWQHTSSGATLLENQQAGRYFATVGDSKGCMVDTVFELKQLFCCDCYFPNAFTPNGDDNNEVFRAISPSTDIKEYRMSVYNRWGARVFKTDRVDGAWDGTINGEPSPIGTYYYKCRMKCLNSKDDVFLMGDILLIR